GVVRVFRGGVLRDRAVGGRSHVEANDSDGAGRRRGDSLAFHLDGVSRRECGVRGRWAAAGTARAAVCARHTRSRVALCRRVGNYSARGLGGVSILFRASAGVEYLAARARVLRWRAYLVRAQPARASRVSARRVQFEGLVVLLPGGAAGENTARFADSCARRTLVLRASVARAALLCAARGCCRDSL